jgi:ABC-2 type transport system permease protein
VTVIRRLILELTLLIRGGAVITGVALLIAGGAMAIAHGRRVIDDQRSTLLNSASLQREEQQAILAPAPGANAGDQLYYLFFHTVREPAPWAAVAIGQRDVQPFNLKVRLLALHGQLYDGELGNPLLASFGNFDLAFVFVVLSPLLVIALTFNTFSGERESGAWDLLRSQPARAGAVLAVRYLLKSALAWLTLLGLLGLAAIVLNLPVDAHWWTVAGWLAIYVLFWTAASAAVNALGRGSDVNILVLLGIWIGTAVMGPALVNVAAAARYPLPEGLELTVAQREGYHSAWDRPLPETMAAFYERYPEWASVPLPADRYSNGWYYAMQQRGDDLAEPIARRYRASLINRERLAARASSLFPPVVLQRALTRLAGTDLQSYLGYLDSVAAHHEQLKRHFLPVIFSDRTVHDVDWNAAPRHRYRDH